MGSDGTRPWYLSNRPIRTRNGTSRKHPRRDGFIEAGESVDLPEVEVSPEMLNIEPEEIVEQEVKPVSLTGKDLYKSIVRTHASQYGWGDGAEWQALETLVYRESSWRPDAQNPKSTASYLFQFLDQTWATVGCVKSQDIDIQAKCGLKYINQRYGSPSKALYFWEHIAPKYNGTNWY